MSEPFEPDWVVAPAETLRDWLVDHNMHPSELAEICEMPMQRLVSVLGGARYGAVTAAQLAKGTGLDARFWLKLETIYRQGLAMGKVDTSTFEPIDTNER